jgi:enoyl-CoA hydratase/carnithine racemase
LGVPVARTLGNCLSMGNLARLVDRVGTARATDLLLSGRLVDAEEALACGLASRVVPAESLDREVAALAGELATRAPSTVVATKALLLRLSAERRPPAADDIIARCYASEEFREGVRAFTEGRPPRW